MFSSQVSQVPHGVRPTAQLLSMPSTLVPLGSAPVLNLSWPAAGPEKRISVSPVMRRAYLELGTTAHLPPVFLTSSTVPPCAIISTSAICLVILAKGVVLPRRASRRPRPGNISSSFVYSWLTQSSPCSDGLAAPDIGR